MKQDRADMEPEKFLPIGIQNFEQMITGGFLYVDKTRFIHEMVRPPRGYYFLARPQRFGKSLTVSTLESLFLGKRELFKWLWIDGNDWEWKRYQVIKIDFNTISFATPDQLEESLILYIRQLCDAHGVRAPYKTLKESFSTLLTGIYLKTGIRSWSSSTNTTSRSSTTSAGEGNGSKSPRPNGKSSSSSSAC